MSQGLHILATKVVHKIRQANIVMNIHSNIPKIQNEKLEILHPDNYLIFQKYL